MTITAPASGQLHITHRAAYLSGVAQGKSDALAGSDYRPGGGETDGQHAYGLGYEAGWDEWNPCSNGTCDHLAHQAIAAPAVPDLSDLPPEPVVPDRDAVDSWSLPAMGGYLEALDSRAAWYSASMAAQRQQAGSRHLDVMLSLSAAEGHAPDSERPAYAARLDAYADAYGLRGWYRYVDSHGKHRVQVNKIRTREDGDHGRYYVSTAFAHSRPRVVDRDTGQFVTGPVTRDEADAWIAAAETAQRT